MTIASSGLGQVGDEAEADDAAIPVEGEPAPPPADGVAGDVRGETTFSTKFEAGLAAGPKWDLPPLPTWGSSWKAQLEDAPGPPALPDLPPLGATPARLTVREAVARALQNNPGLIAQSLNPVIQQQGIQGALAFFDPVFGSDVDYTRSLTPATSTLQSGFDLPQTTQVLELDNASTNWNFFARKGLASGATLRVDFLNNKLRTNSPFQGLVPQYNPEAAITLNQPLLRGFGFYFTRLRLRIAETATDAAVEDYRAAVSNFIFRVVRAYWDVVLTSDQLSVRRDSLTLAQQTVRDNQTRVDVGVLPPVAVKESEAEAARREEEVIVAENANFQAMRVLQQIVYLPGYNDWLPRAIEPVDTPSTDRVEIAPEKALQTAVTQRGEVRSARLGVEANELNVAFNRNQLMPRVDVFGTYGVNSISGDPTRDTSPETLSSIYGGTYGDAVGRLTSNDFFSYGGGIRIEVPLGNAAAEAEFKQSRLQREQASASYRQRVADVTLEVGQAVGDTTSNMKRIEASRVARELAEENLRNQTKRYEVGMVTTTDLLKFQNEVANARLNENQAVVDYNNSVTALERAQGTLLARFNVEIDPRGNSNLPWWSRF